jgi:hypothetical protein
MEFPSSYHGKWGKRNWNQRQEQCLRECVQESWTFEESCTENWCDVLQQVSLTAPNVFKREIGLFVLNPGKTSLHNLLNWFRALINNTCRVWQIKFLNTHTHISHEPISDRVLESYSRALIGSSLHTTHRKSHRPYHSGWVTQRNSFRFFFVFIWGNN